MDQTEGETIGHRTDQMGMDNIERIGKVKLDYSHYSGEDLYSDGDIEDRILDLVKHHAEDGYQDIIEESRSWPVLYHLSSLRSNIIEWLPFTKHSRVLEIGAGCGAITGMLCDKAGHVVGVDLSDRRCRINAHRNRKKENLTLHVGNFRDIEPDLSADFDFILLIGVLEYSGLYMDPGAVDFVGMDSGVMDAQAPYEDMLKMLYKHLRADGRLVIAIENRLGLKYWAGCVEDHSGRLFDGIEGYPEGGSARTFTRRGLEGMLKGCGIQEYSFYYPYPDYKFMTTLYSDARIPAKGELTNNIRNFDRDRMVLFHEKYAFDSMIEEGLFPEFSNSYLVITGKPPETIYVKYSNDRAAKYAIRTEIRGRKEKEVWKTALDPAAIPHILKMEETYRSLCKKYEGSGLSINRCHQGEDSKSVIFEYLEGSTLEEGMDGCLERGDMTGFEALFDRFWDYTKYGEGRGGGSTNYDLVFSNFILSAQNPAHWTLIDYEWYLDQEIPPSEIAYRAFHCYLLEEEKRNKIDVNRFWEKLNVTSADIQMIANNERHFQKMVTAGKKSMGDIRAACGTCLFGSRDFIKEYHDRMMSDRVQIYYDYGAGFSEQESEYIGGVYLTDQVVQMALTVSDTVRALRLDPANQACAVRIGWLKWNDRILSPLDQSITTNARIIRDGYFVFATEDPNISLPTGSWAPDTENRLEIGFEIIRMPLSLAETLAGSAKNFMRRR